MNIDNKIVPIKFIIQLLSNFWSVKTISTTSNKMKIIYLILSCLVFQVGFTL